MATILFKNANLLDPRTDVPQDGFSVLVEGETIAKCRRSRSSPRKADVIDCKGRTLMPGLIDCHVHAMLSEVNLRFLESIPLTLMTVRAASLVRAMLDRGFTTVRDTGGADWGLRDGIAQAICPARGCSSQGAHWGRPADTPTRAVAPMSGAVPAAAAMR
jgi:imidazolonepropionase-like amidohydrolase